MNDFICNHCIHKNVCSLRDTYERFQTAIKSTSIYEDCHDKSVREIPISSVDWLKVHDLGCKNFYEERQTR